MSRSVAMFRHRHVISHPGNITQDERLPLDQLITLWLDEKSDGGKSNRTLATYREILGTFREMIQGQGLDLDSDAFETVAMIAQGYAKLHICYTGGKDGHRRKCPPDCTKQVSSSTQAQRLAVISSFYLFAMKRPRQSGITANPIDIVKRPKVKPYGSATPLADVDLSEIDRSTEQGKRDYAILALLLTTGRRASEIARLTRHDLDIQPSAVIMTTHVKGGEDMKDELAREVAFSLVEYLGVAYPDGMRDADPLFLAVSNRNKGKQISIQTVGDICKRYLGTSKIHATRHTFAVRMDKRGAPLAVIQRRLGHKNAATTGIYLGELKDQYNPFADILASEFGIGQ